MAKKFYITTPIYYANDVGHIGNLFATTFSDVIARYYRSKLGKDNVYFTTGLDEHGTTVENSAKKNGYTDYKKYVDERADYWINDFSSTQISYNYFARTTNPSHEKFASDFVKKMISEGDVYKDVFKGKYCYGHEKFLTASDIDERGLCPDHRPDQVIEVEEENYFFKLSKYAPKVKELIENGEINVKPDNKRKEILARIDQGVEDQSISRPKSKVTWAIEFPDDGSQTIYVWVEALLNYLSSLEINGKWGFWEGETLHVLGKDINWFHNLIWPAMLLSAGYPLFKRSFVHSFYTVGGRKMSKSSGNVIAPKDLVSKYGVDGTRYLLLANTPYQDDVDITWEALDARYNSDLANGLGNLVSRVAKLAEGTMRTSLDAHGITPKSGSSLNQDHPEMPLSLKKAYDELRLHDVTSEINNLVSEANEYLDEKTPWKLEGEPKQKVLEVAIQKIIQIAKAAEPVIPETSRKIQKIFTSHPIKPAEVLFKRI